MVPKPTDDDGWGDVASGSASEDAAPEDKAPDKATEDKAAAAPEPTAHVAPLPARPSAIPDDEGWGDDDGWGAPAPDPEPEPEPEHAAEPALETPLAPPPEAAPAPAPRQKTIPKPAPAPTPAPVAAAPAAPRATDREPDPWSAPSHDSDDDPLAEAVGVKKKKKKKDKPPREPWFTAKQRRNIILAVLAIGAIAAMIVVSKLNAAHVYMTCGDNEVRAERGRFFLWGRSKLGGAKWKPVPIDKACGDRELESEAALEAAFLELVLAQANKSLSKQPPEDIDRAAEMLEQAALLARDPSREAERTEIERLGNDVKYWRANATVEQAVTNLEGARAEFEKAAGQTRHTGDAGSRAAFLEQLIGAAKSGAMPTPPANDDGETPTPTPVVDAGPTGPVPVDDPPIDTDVDAAPPPPREPPIPSGGVLL